MSTMAAMPSTAPSASTGLFAPRIIVRRSYAVPMFTTPCGGQVGDLPYVLLRWTSSTRQFTDAVLQAPAEQAGGLLFWAGRRQAPTEKTDFPTRDREGAVDSLPADRGAGQHHG
jgi:hypothetical protein